MAKIEGDAGKKIAESKTELEREQQKTAAAQAAYKKAQLELDRYLATRIFQREPRWEFLEPLKTRSPAKAEVICKKDDGEAWFFAARIVQALKSMHWDVSGPVETDERLSGGAPLVGAFVIFKTPPDMLGKGAAAIFPKSRLVSAILIVEDELYTFSHHTRRTLHPRGVYGSRGGGAAGLRASKNCSKPSMRWISSGVLAHFLALSRFARACSRSPICASA